MVCFVLVLFSIHSFIKIDLIINKIGFKLVNFVFITNSSLNLFIMLLIDY